MEWDIQRLQMLIDKYLADACTGDEKKELEAWYESLGEDDWDYTNDEKKEDLRTGILNSIILERGVYPAEQAPVIDIQHRSSGWKSWLSAVAILVVLIGIGGGIYHFTGRSPSREFATAFGHIDTLVLPDNSWVILNANSRISYKSTWKKDQPRELWLKGEALFKVIHVNNNPIIKPNERFVVHVKDARIEVLGTVFNIRERRGKTEIVLQEGRIKVSFTNGQPDAIMQPGEILTIDPEKKAVKKAITQADDYIAWTRRKLILEDPSLKEIIEYLEDNYGKRIVLSDPALADLKLGGTLMIDNLDDALLILSKTLNLQVIEENSTLFITLK